MTDKQYAVRDAMALDEAGGHYFRHVMAMTAEKLHSKGDIAAELGYRDMQIAALQDQVQKLAAENSTVRVMNDALSEELRGYESDGAYEGPNMHKLWHSNADMPATDAVIREIGAKAVEGLRNHPAIGLLALGTEIDKSAAKLRAGEQP